MNDKLLSLLGIARRAGRLSLGFDSAEEAIKKGKSRLLILASDLSERSKNAIIKTAQLQSIRTIVLDVTMDKLGTAVGKTTGIISVNDRGFAEKMKTLCTE